jgi:hypothetical protein
MLILRVQPTFVTIGIFIWLPCVFLPDQATLAIARSDDTTFGILHSRFHELWSLRMGTSLEDRPRYTPTTTFETFPFPEGLTPADTAPKSEPPPGEGAAKSPSPPGGGVGVGAVESARTVDSPPFSTPTPAITPHAPARTHARTIAQAAFRLNQLRESWLNPPEWVEWVQTPEEKEAGFPPRPTARPGHEADLKKRTLTNLYNARPAWLHIAHRDLDAAVACAYGWDDYTEDMEDATILGRLLALNQLRTKSITN